MGNLRKYMPITAATFIVGWLAIAGVPPFAGFWSKDEILLFAWDKSPVLWFLGLVTALLTAFYMSRQVFMVFFGDERLAGPKPPPPTRPAAGRARRRRARRRRSRPRRARPRDHGHDPHESPWLMTLPARRPGGAGAPRRWPQPAVHASPQAPRAVARAGRRRPGARPPHATGTKVVLAAVAVAVGLIGIGLARSPVYLQKRARPIEPEILAAAWHYDDAVSAFVGGPGRAGFEATATLRPRGRGRRRQRRGHGGAGERHAASRSSRAATCGATPSASPSAWWRSSPTSSAGCPSDADLDPGRGGREHVHRQLAPHGRHPPALRRRGGGVPHPPGPRRAAPPRRPPVLRRHAAPSPSGSCARSRPTCPGSSSSSTSTGSPTSGSRGTWASTGSRCSSSCSPASCSRWRSSP